MEDNYLIAGGGSKVEVDGGSDFTLDDCVSEGPRTNDGGQHQDECALDGGASSTTRVERRQRPIVRNNHAHRLKRMIDGAYGGSWADYLSDILIQSAEIRLPPADIERMVRDSSIYNTINGAKDCDEQVKNELGRQVTLVRRLYLNSGPGLDKVSMSPVA